MAGDKATTKAIQAALIVMQQGEEQVGTLGQIAIHQFLGFMQRLVVSQETGKAPDQQHDGANGNQETPAQRVRAIRLRQPRHPGPPPS